MGLSVPEGFAVAAVRYKGRKSADGWRWAMGDGRWATGDGRWAMGTGLALAGSGGQVPLLSSHWLTSTIPHLSSTTAASVVAYPSDDSYTHNPDDKLISAFSLDPTPPHHALQTPKPDALLPKPTLEHLSDYIALHHDISVAASSWYNSLHWIASRASWIDRQVRTWIGSISEPGGPVYVLKEENGLVPDASGLNGNGLRDLSAFWASGQSKPEDWSEEERLVREIPQYVLDYAPLIHLYSGEQFWPCDIAEHLQHTKPFLNHTLLESDVERRNLSDLDALNIYRPFVYLTSDDNVEDRPEWLGGKSNIPEQNRIMADPTGTTESTSSRESEGGRSDAPAILVVIDKGDGIVDAFWFFFYSYNLGNTVLNVRFGNHVGDWEHTLVRFKDREPESVFFSEHVYGEAYSYGAVEKIGRRPVGYSASGTHAMYATSGVHKYVLPWGLLHDLTDRGPLWDPALNAHSYTYDVKTETLRSSNMTPKAPTEWFNFAGHWGDRTYPLSDRRQYLFAGQYHYVSGPLGPRFKSLGRKKVCPGNGDCKIKHWRSESARPRRWRGGGTGEELSEEEMAIHDDGIESFG